MPAIAALLEELAPDTVGALGDALDALVPAERIAAVRGIGRRAQARLYEACVARGEGAGIEFLLDDEAPSWATAIFEGKNSLPLFSRFQKRFTRLPYDMQRLAGYNHQSMSWLTGPGHFTVRIDRDTLLFDYTQLAERVPDSWPALKPNDRWVSRLVYMNMHDYCYPVGRHTLIGAAFDGPSGKPKGQTFLLTRGKWIPSS